LSRTIHISSSALALTLIVSLAQSALSSRPAGVSDLAHTVGPLATDLIQYLPHLSPDIKEAHARATVDHMNRDPHIHHSIDRVDIKYIMGACFDLLFGSTYSSGRSLTRCKRSCLSR
jgi:hypothetical protein